MGYKFKTLSEMEPWEKQYLENIRVINRSGVSIFLWTHFR